MAESPSAMHETAQKRPQWKRRLLVGGLVFTSLVLGWHVYLTIRLNIRASQSRSATTESGPMLSVSINPLTNLATMTVKAPPTLEDDEPFAALGAAFGDTLVQAIGPGFLERELNTQARAHFDLYAMLIPYRVRVLRESASSEDIEKLRAEREKRRIDAARAREEIEAEREKRRLEEKQAKADAEAARLKLIRDYITSSLSLESLSVSRGKSYGQEVDGVFGTVVNNGPQSLSEVTLRVYFLDDSGRRIGETDFYPVLVSRFSSGDQSPLRPGYRKDFGYSVEKSAPSGWARKIEAEIVDIEFLRAE